MDLEPKVNHPDGSSKVVHDLIFHIDQLCCLLTCSMFMEYIPALTAHKGSTVWTLTQVVNQVLASWALAYEYPI